MDESTSMSSGRTLAARTRKTIRSSSPANRSLMARTASPSMGVNRLLALKGRPSLDRQGAELEKLKSQLSTLSLRVEKLSHDLKVETERADTSEKAWDHERDKALFYEEGYNNLKSQTDSDQANAMARIQSLESTNGERSIRSHKAGEDFQKKLRSQNFEIHKDP